MKALFFGIIVLGASLLFVLPSAPAHRGPTIISYPDPTPLPNYLSIGWVGDMVPATSSYNSSVFAQVTRELSTPDLMIGNLESTFAADGRVSKCNFLSLQCHAFRGDANFADALKTAGFDFISLVNNHSFDYGIEGLRDTERELDRVGIPYISPLKPRTSITMDGTKIGILGLSSTPPTVTIADYAFIEREVTKLKTENDIVIVIMHAGAEGTTKTDVPGTTEYVGTENRGDVQKVARTAIDAGADLVLGSGPHVLRKVEVYKESVIAYSLGNFVGGNQKLTTRGLLGVSGIFTTTFANNEIHSYDLTSIHLSKEGVPSIDPTDAGKQLIESLAH